MSNSCGSVRNERWEKDEQRQSMTTWGLVALTVFISLGLAEWSKRTAASETVIDPMVMKEAIKIAAAANVKVNLNENATGFRKRESEKGDGSRPSYAASPLRGAATEGFGDREEKIQTSTGE